VSAISASVGELVQIQFFVFDVDGITPLTGLVDGDFTKTLLLDDATSAVTVTVTEVGATGRYVVDFTPTAAGLWYVDVVLPDTEAVWACNVEVGPPPDDWIDAIADGVWAELLPNGFPAGSAGARLAQASDDAALLRSALIAANLAATAGSTDTVINTGATQTDDYYNGLLVVVVNSTGTVGRRITDYAMTDGAFTLNEALPFTPDVDDPVIVLGLLGEVTLSADSSALLKLCEVHRILGLDAEAPLCISKTKSEAGDIVLNQTEVGKKVIVQRQV
jgi:hypothetical protein